jgi:hypothetical protein
MIRSSKKCEKNAEINKEKLKKVLDHRFFPLVTHLIL